VERPCGSSIVFEEISPARGVKTGRQTIINRDNMSQASHGETKLQKTSRVPRFPAFQDHNSAVLLQALLSDPGLIGTEAKCTNTDHFDWAASLSKYEHIYFRHQRMVTCDRTTEPKPRSALLGPGLYYLLQRV
jgi:hypothetical protein